MTSFVLPKKRHDEQLRRAWPLHILCILNGLDALDMHGRDMVQGIHAYIVVCWICRLPAREILFYFFLCPMLCNGIGGQCNVHPYRSIAAIVRFDAFLHSSCTRTGKSEEQSSATMRQSGKTALAVCQLHTNPQDGSMKRLLNLRSDVVLIGLKKV